MWQDGLLFGKHKSKFPLGNCTGFWSQIASPSDRSSGLMFIVFIFLSLSVPVCMCFKHRGSKLDIIPNEASIISGLHNALITALFLWEMHA